MRKNVKKIKKEIVYVIAVGSVFFGLSLFCWIKPVNDFSATERRKLATFPEVTTDTIKSGLFMEKFETYTLDQFPLRDTFRTIKAFTHKYILGQSDNNEVYLADGYISKLDFPYHKKATERAVAKFNWIYENLIKESQSSVYYAIIPDKNFFLAEKNRYPSMDYEKLYADIHTGLEENMTYIEIADLLEIGDYYYTDTHWKQECITDVAKRLAEGMGIKLYAEYKTVSLDNPFYGVYYGQLGLLIQPDSISYLEHPMFEECKVYDYQNQREIQMYSMDLAKGRDAYEMYLSGSLSVITIENPNATTEKELVIFRDSFGSSIAPLFAEAYAKITLLDIRYLNQNLIRNFVTFDNQDVLFLYSTGVLNNRGAF